MGQTAQLAGQMRPTSRNRAGREGLRFFNRMRPSTRECFTCFFEVLDKINITNIVF